jgi:hypothetical protein
LRPYRKRLRGTRPVRLKSAAPLFIGMFPFPRQASKAHRNIASV